VANKDEWKTAGTGSSWNYADEGKDASIQGIYLVKEEGVGENNSNIYTLETKDGETVSIWGSTVLDGKFRQVKPGQEVLITYLGKEKNPKTGRTYHNFDLKYRDTPFKNVEDADMGDLLKELEEN
jgi:hypothetical protein